jgi:phosphate transport system protein
MNTLLEARLHELEKSLDELSHLVEENLRTVLLRLTQEEPVCQRTALINVQTVAHSVCEKCLLVMAREHPMASDLKYVMAALRLGHDFERINELTVALNKRLDRLRGNSVPGVMTEIENTLCKIIELYEIVRRTWHKGEQREKLLSETRNMSAAIDQNIGKLRNQILDAMSKGAGTAVRPEVFVELVLACRHLKRIAANLNSIPEEICAFDRTATNPACKDAE